MAINSYTIGIILWFGHLCSTAADCRINTSGVYTFGPECQFMCHCKNDAGCDIDTGECSGGCDTSWFGPACQYRDLAESHLTKHSSNKDPPQYSRNANDGDISTCSYTTDALHSQEKPWWKVWFPQNETIRDVYIHTTNVYLGHFRSFEVTVEYVPENKNTDLSYIPTYKHTCYQNGNTQPQNASIQVQCDQPTVGNQVRIKLSTIQSQLVLCDVRINAGINYAFRKYVSASQYNSDYPPFNAVDGRLGSTSSTVSTGCFAASNTGNKTLDINLGISIYTYSVKINTKNDDYIRDYQIYTAPTGQTGLQLIYHDTGNIRPVRYVHLNTNIQQLRIQTNNANQLVICELEIYGECPSNKCGFDCSEKCYCKSREYIEHRISGICTTGCQNRWTGPNGKCYIECDDTKWGTHCQFDCGACRIGTCDVVSGECTGGCQAGYYTTPYCKTECTDGYYGINCTHTCSVHCVDLCNKYNGTCSCSTGWQGDTCRDDIEQSIQSNTIAIIVGVVVGLVVICVTIVVVCFIMNRRRKTPTVVTKPEGHDEMSKDPTSISYGDLRRNVDTNDEEETKYETINPDEI